MPFSPHQLAPSARGRRNIAGGDHNEETDLDGLPLYDPVKSPDGVIALWGAENELMADWLRDYCAAYGSHYQLANALEYGGVAGSQDLVEAIAGFINRKFKPATIVAKENILVTNGVSSLIDMVAFNICDDGEGLMLTTPTYSQFGRDLTEKAGVTLLHVSTDGIEDQFSAKCAARLIGAFERVYNEAVASGVKVKAVLLCNPSNPVGRFYSRETLVAVAKFCGEREMHLVSDEIYAMSGFDPAPGESFLENFTSVLSLKDDPARRIYTKNIHTFYGASKDFSMGGLRLGFLITRNDQVWKACRRVAIFTWVSTFSSEFFTDFIGNAAVVDEYLSTFQGKLRQKYLAVSAAMKENSIPFDFANSCLFVWIDLGQWLQYFEGPDHVGRVPTSAAAAVQREEETTRERQLSRHLVHHGVLLSDGELSASPTPGRFRFVYTTVDDRALFAVQRIRKALDELECGKKYLPRPSHAKHESGGGDDEESSLYMDKPTEFSSGEGNGRENLISKLRRALCFED